MLNAKMTFYKIENIKLTISFFSITIGWILTNLFYSIYLVWTYGKATDSGVVLFWSGLFIYIAWAIFIIYPLKRLDHSKPLFKKLVFPIASAVYAALAFTILVGGLFRDIILVGMFIPLALLVGLFFGLTYSILIRNEKIVSLLNDRPLFKIFSFVSPIIILTFLLWILPAVSPSLVYRYVPEQIRDKIFIKTISKFKKGDSFKKLNKALPGEFDEWIQNGEGGISSSGSIIDYDLQVKKDTIQKLEMVIH